MIELCQNCNGNPKCAGCKYPEFCYACAWRAQTREEWIDDNRPQWQCAGCHEIFVTVPIAKDYICPVCEVI